MIGAEWKVLLPHIYNHQLRKNRIYALLRKSQGIIRVNIMSYFLRKGIEGVHLR